MSKQDPYAAYGGHQETGVQGADPYSKYGGGVESTTSASTSRTPGGATGSWDGPSTPEMALRTVLGPFAGLGKGAVDAAGNILHLPVDIYRAAMTPPQTNAEKLASASAGSLGLLTHRLLIQPQIDELKKGVKPLSPDERSALKGGLTKADLGGESVADRDKNAVADLLERGGHTLAGITPVLGPLAAHLGERLGSGDVSGALGEGLTYALAPDALEETKAAAKAGVRSITPHIQHLQEHAITSLIQPDKSSFDFGGDPVSAAEALPPSANIPSMRQKVQALIKDQTGKIQQAINTRRSLAQQEGQPTGIDVGPYLQGTIKQAVDSALADGNKGLARQIRAFGDAQLQRIQKQYGSTYLEPEQIIHEKQTLADNTKFVEDQVGKNLNTARMQLYKSYDGALNSMFGGDPVTGMDTPVKVANRNVASLIELDRLLERKNLRNMKAPMTGSGGVVGTLRALSPETLPKTMLNLALGGGEWLQVHPTNPAYEFFGRRQPGPYESGYQPNGIIAPSNPEPYPAQGRGPAAPSTSGSGLRLVQEIPDPHTGKTARWVYLNNAGQQVISTVKLH